MITPPRPKTVTRFARARRACWSLLLAFAATSLHAAPPTMGVYINGSDEAEHDRYEDFVRQSLSHIVAFGPSDNWQAISGREIDGTLISPPYGLGWAVNQWDVAYRPRVVWSIPLLPDSGANLASGANGAYDAHWVNVATTLVNAGYGNNIIRLGWEFMGDWYPWSVRGTGWNGQPNTVNYRNYWKRVVLAMRSVPGANFKFNWCGNPGDFWSGNVKLNPADAYPDADANGDYVDEIGFDVYDTSWSHYPVDPTHSQSRQDNVRNTVWLSKLTWGTYNINWWTTFAASKGKPITVPEWGLNGSDADHGGGDNPVFIQRFHEWAINPAHNVKWHAYFQHDYSFPAQFFEKNETMFPRATEKFLDLFTGRPIQPVFQNPINLINSIGGYGTRSATVVQTDAGHAPFEGDDHYRFTYTTNAGIQLGFPQKNVTDATHLSLAIKGPLTNASQRIKIRLYAADGSYGPLVTLPRTTSYEVVDIPLSTLGSGVNLNQAKSIYFYATTAPVGTSDTVYVDSIQFLQMTP
jgi:hypothetical protein